MEVFIGRDAVEWMLMRNVVECREDAVAYGKRMLAQGLIDHVTHHKGKPTEATVTAIRYHGNQSTPSLPWQPSSSCSSGSACQRHVASRAHLALQISKTVMSSIIFAPTPPT